MAMIINGKKKIIMPSMKIQNGAKIQDGHVKMFLLFKSCKFSFSVKFILD
jgi:hypothetical protein